MKLLQIVPRNGTRLYGAMVKREAEIRKSGRGTFSRAGRKRASAARWKHARYAGSISLQRAPSEMITVKIKSPDQGDEARLLSAFLGWIGRHFGAEVQTINIQYQPVGRRSRG
jgi:hypothetical protein